MAILYPCFKEIAKDIVKPYADYATGAWGEIASEIDTSNITDMSFMFYDLLNLTTLSLSNFNTSNVTKMDSMFEWLPDLIKLDVSNFDTTNVTSMDSMFKNCKALKSLDLSSFDTSNVTNMAYMFFNFAKDAIGKVKIWIPSTFTAAAVTDDASKPFYRGARSAGVDVYTDATSAEQQSWGTIDSTFNIHYGVTHDDYLNV
ncbi:hypothetical protein [Butyrivibrio virus Arian]|nr:hypothetical protein [Butyrivibrio virus Arian]